MRRVAAAVLFTATALVAAHAQAPEADPAPRAAADHDAVAGEIDSAEGGAFLAALLLSLEWSMR